MHGNINDPTRAGPVIVGITLLADPTVAAVKIAANVDVHLAVHRRQHDLLHQSPRSDSLPS